MRARPVLLLAFGSLARLRGASFLAPQASAAAYDIVRGTTACGNGTYGTASGGSPRFTPACP
jgi:hypothetical protein